jgi:hypothetical protein
MSDPLEDSLNIDPVEPKKQEKQLRKKVEIDTSNYPDRQLLQKVIVRERLRLFLNF